MPYGIQMININKFTILYGQPNRIIINILKLAKQFFSYLPCEINCIQLCLQHQPPRTLLPQFTIPSQELHVHPQSNQALINLLPPPPRLPPHILLQIKNCPSNTILKHHTHTKIDIHDTTKQYNTYLCQ